MKKNKQMYLFTNVDMAGESLKIKSSNGWTQLYQYSNLQCCGNCRHRGNHSISNENTVEEFCRRKKGGMKKNIHSPSFLICLHWKYDGLAKEERMI